MNTLESVLSFLVFLSLFSSIILVEEHNSSAKHSELNRVYLLKLSEDIWRVLYLRGDFDHFDKNKLNKDLESIYELTHLCVSFQEEDVASCLPSEYVESRRFLPINGVRRIISMRVGVNEG